MTKKYILCILTVATLLFSSCNNREGNVSLSPAEQKLLTADSVARDAIYRFDRIAFFNSNPEQKVVDGIIDSIKCTVDSLERCGDLNELAYNELCGELYMYFLKVKKSDEYFNLVWSQEKTKGLDNWHRKIAGNYLAYHLYMSHNYEGFLRVAVPLISWMDSLENNNWDQFEKLLPERYSNSTYCTWAQKMNLYSLLGCCYLKLEQRDKAQEVLELFDTFSQKLLAEDSSRISPLFINTYARVKDAYVRIRDWEKVRHWMNRSDTLGYIYAEHHPESYICQIYDDYRNLDNAIRMWSLGDKDSAAAEYAEFKSRESFNSLNALIQSNDYLVNAERWEDAADNYQYLDLFVETPYLEEISAYYFPKFRANYYAGRKDSALKVALQIAELFDSAFLWDKKSQMAEMATIYDTQGKEMEIARQQAKLSRQRLIGTGLALVLITLFFIVYTWYRHRAEKRLSTAHSQLQEAYNQLEETTTAKERIESELRIARDIQMSMVPGVFPEYEGLDMYAYMTPAKEVGGDLYGYVMQGNQLYFCVGDVSGKGVPASLFMAQSARLFRTLAAEGMMPAGIATRMNNALAENNDRGMFVTMFIGLLHLDSGRLDYCNCGHNAPLLDGQFIDMKYVNQPLGLWEDDPFEGESIEKIRGRQLLVYTDGLNEAENQQQELLGNNRLQEIMSNAKGLDSRQVIEMLKTAVEQHRAGADPNDDLTIMCIKLQ